MLAKELKIQNLKRQREFIEEQLRIMLEHPLMDGNTCFRYVGHIYPENLEYFRDEGFAIYKNTSEKLFANLEGFPLYVFTVSDEVKLDESELIEAENVYEEDVLPYPLDPINVLMYQLKPSEDDEDESNDDNGDDNGNGGNDSGPDSGIQIIRFIF